MQKRRGAKQAPIANGQPKGQPNGHANTANGHVKTPNGHVKTPNGHAKTPNGKLPKPEKTDYLRWRLLDESGRQTWHYLTKDSDVKKWPQSIADKYHLGLPTVRLPVCLYWASSSNLHRASQNYPLPRNLHSQ